MCVRLSVRLFQLFSHRCIVCTTSPTSKWTVPARTYLKINAVLDVAKKFISFTGVSLSSAHTPKHTKARTDSISVTTHRQNGELVTDLCVSSDSGSIALLLEDQTNTWPYMFHHFPQVFICDSSHSRTFELCLCFTGSSKGGENRGKYSHT